MYLIIMFTYYAAQEQRHLNNRYAEDVCLTLSRVLISLGQIKGKATGLGGLFLVKAWRGCPTFSRHVPSGTLSSPLQNRPAR